jgi:hypothetical protein
VELCLFDSLDAESESLTIPLPEQTDMVWHGYLPDVHPGSSTATACTGPTHRSGASLQPEQAAHGSLREGRRRTTRWNEALFGFTMDGDDTTFDDRDSAPYAPIAAVVDTAFTWGDDRPLRTPWHKTVIYELHVKGFTQDQPPRPRGAARHVPRPGERAGHPAPDVARRDGGRADAGAPPYRRVAPRPEAGCGTTGATTRCRTSRPTSATRRPRRRWMRCASSR